MERNSYYNSNKISYRMNEMSVDRHNLKFYEYLFENRPFISTQNFYKFIILDLKTLDINKKDKVYELLNELIHNNIVLEMYGKLICFFFDNIDINFENIVNAMNDDFSTNIKLFESGKMNVNKREGFKIIFEAFLRYSIKKPRTYTNNRSLILDVAESDIQALKPLGAIILSRIYQDSQLERLIKALFDNNLNVSKTAQDVFMHRNTVNNKLDYIYSETQLKIQTFNDATAMYLLMLIK